MNVLLEPGALAINHSLAGGALVNVIGSSQFSAACPVADRTMRIAPSNSGVHD